MSGQLVLVGNAADGTIASFWIRNERLVAGAVSKVGLGCSTFSSAGERVFVAVKDPAIVVCELDRSTGALTEKSRHAIAAPLAYLTLTPGGARLLGASYHGGWATAWPINGERIGGPLSGLNYCNPHSIVASPCGQFAYLAALGDDLVVVCEISDAGLSVLQEVSAPAGSGPRHVMLSRDGRSLYLVTEFTGKAIRYARDPAAGILTPGEEAVAHDATRGMDMSSYGADPMAEHLIWGADLHLSGSWLLCSERTESTITAIRVGVGGQLVATGPSTEVEAQPRGFAVSPDARLAVVAGQSSGKVGLYRIEEATGTLVRLDRVTSGMGPNWVRFL